MSVCSRAGRRARCLFLVFAFSVGIAALCAAQSPAPRSTPGTWVGSPIVTTRYGDIQGHLDSEETWLWAAIPFARPPVGELRWRAPQDPLPWKGVRDVRVFNSGCTQFSPVVMGNVFGSEDCLYLNVWRPRDAAKGLPVYVWIHGGSNATGSATFLPDYYGTGIASRSHMVFVSMNYRLGPFGWFSSPAIRGQASPADASGNYGTLDIIKALQWTRDNIAAFGGDPANVTITGESAGGLNVLSLLIAAPAKGLFRRAMSESGGAITYGIPEADAVSQHVLDRLVLPDAGSQVGGELPDVAAAALSRERELAYLRSKSDRDILRCFDEASPGLIDNPSIIRDGAVIPREGFDVFASGNYPNKVPLIIGSNKDEMKLFLFLSSGIAPSSALYDAIARYGSDLWKASGVDEVARRLSRHPDQPSVFAYQFRWGSPDPAGKSVLPGGWGHSLGAFHSEEVPFFLGTDTLDVLLHIILFTPENQTARKALSTAMMAYAANFARNGDPNPSGGLLPKWAPWENKPGAGKCIVFDVQGEIRAITMMNTELTTDGVLAALRSNLPEPVRTQTLQFLRASKLPAGIRNHPDR